MNCDSIRNYDSVYHSVLIECSNQSAGIQLADYAVGVMYGYLRKSFIGSNNYTFAADMYTDYIAGKIRHDTTGNVMGYGIREVPSRPTYRQRLALFFAVQE